MKRGADEEAGAPEVAELAALADGSLTREQRAELEARVDGLTRARGAGSESSSAPSPSARARPSRSRRRPGCGRASTRSGARAGRSSRRLALAGVVAAVAVAAVIGVAVIGSGTSSTTFHAALAPTGP